MAEENDQAQAAEAQTGSQHEPQAEAPQAEPHGGQAGTEQADATDWKAMARMWERRAKENSDAQGRLKAANERAEKAEREAESLKRQRDLADWAAKASSETGIPQGVIRGGTYEEMLAHAQAIKATVPIYPSVQQQHGGAAPALTKESILAIEDDAERRAAIADNLELFK